MALLQSPTLYGVATFDADNAQVFEYIWDGPTQKPTPAVKHGSVVRRDHILPV